MIERLPDAAQSFGNSSSLRFSRKTPFDFYLYAGRSYDLFCLELKSISGKSISFERTKEEKGVIHYHQIIGLTQKSNYPDITAGFLLNFRNIEKTYFLDIRKFNMMINNISRKSFNLNDLLLYSPILIQQEKKRTRYQYDLHKFLYDVENELCIPPI